MWSRSASAVRSLLGARVQNMLRFAANFAKFWTHRGQAANLSLISYNLSTAKSSSLNPNA